MDSFRNGRIRFVEEQRPGRPRTASIDRNAEKFEELIRVTVDETADKLGIIHGRVHIKLTRNSSEFARDGCQIVTNP